MEPPEEAKGSGSKKKPMASRRGTKQTCNTPGFAIYTETETSSSNIQTGNQPMQKRLKSYISSEVAPKGYSANRKGEFRLDDDQTQPADDWKNTQIQLNGKTGLTSVTTVFVEDPVERKLNWTQALAEAHQLSATHQKAMILVLDDTQPTQEKGWRCSNGCSVDGRSVAFGKVPPCPKNKSPDYCGLEKI